MNRHILIVFFLVIFAMCRSLAFAQDQNYNVDYYSIENGLSQNTINSLYQDSKGFIWIGTQDGLNRFDGYTFTVFRHEPDDSFSISGNFVRHIFPSSNGTYWITTQTGINRFNPETNCFTPFFDNNKIKNSAEDNDIYCIFEDKNNDVWIKTTGGITKYDVRNKIFVYNSYEKDEFAYISDYNYLSLTPDKKNVLWSGSAEGLLAFDIGSTQFTIYKPAGKNKSKDNEVFSTYIDTKNNLWVGTYSGIYRFDIKLKKFFKVKEYAGTVFTIFEDNLGKIWVGTDSGLSYIDRDKNQLIPYQLFNKKNIELQTGRVVSIIQDKSSILWVGTQNGLFKIDLKPINFKLYRNKLSASSIYSIFVENDSLLWFGTRNSGLNIYNRYTGENVVYSTQSKNYIPDDFIHCIQKDRSGNIIIGTNNGAFRFDKLKRQFTDFLSVKTRNFSAWFVKNRISNIVQDNDGNYWFATYNGLLLFDGEKIISFNTKSGKPGELPSNQITRVLQTHSGEIWVSTLNGLALFDRKTKTFINYSKDLNGLSNNSVLSLFESADNTLWVGTETGLNRFDKQTHIFEYYTQKDGFLNDYIYAITDDKNGALWISTNKGISKFDYKTKKITNYSIEDGIQGYEFNIGSYFKTEKGEIFFGGTNGVTAFNPQKIFINKYVPKVVITKFSKIGSSGEKEISLSENSEIFLKSNEHNFRIQFSVLEYSQPNKNQYKYKIIESDTNWVNIGTSHTASFTQLPSGDYTFYVVGSNSDNQWNMEPAVLKIHIAIPWWRTKIAWFFYVSSVGLIIASLILRYNRVIRKENKRLQEREKASKKIEEQKELLAIKNQNISDSIHYAKRIIDAMMPSENFINRLLPESFVLYMPKDIVSGDFYWIHEIRGKIFIATADCTGHGVPGAFMSIIGMDLLRNIIGMGIQSPAEILNKLNHDVSEIFKAEITNESPVKDGMDISICSIDKVNKILEYAGAINPMYLIRNNNIIEYKGDRFFVGPTPENQINHFSSHKIELLEDDVVYFFSDGYTDQFGGPQGKKFKFRRFRHLLLTIHDRDFSTQKKNLENALLSWKNTNEQVDDILLIGIKPLSSNS